MRKLGVMLTVVMALSIAACLPPASVDVGVSVPLPPPIVFSGPPEMVVLPETEVYVAPAYDQDIYFYGGWWWRPWGGRWYRSLYYDSGWAFYNGVPGWYGGVYPHWRDNYRNHTWGGNRWDYHPLPYRDVRTNWKTWHDTGHYQKNWGTTGSYRHGVETRRDFRGFSQETRYQQAPAVAHQAPAQTNSRQAPVTTRQSPAAAQSPKASVPIQRSVDLSKNRNAFAGTYRGSDARTQSNRGLQSRQSIPSRGTGGVSKGNIDRGDAGRPR